MFSDGYACFLTVIQANERLTFEVRRSTILHYMYSEPALFALSSLVHCTCAFRINVWGMFSRMFFCLQGENNVYVCIIIHCAKKLIELQKLQKQK